MVSAVQSQQLPERTVLSCNSCLHQPMSQKVRSLVILSHLGLLQSSTLGSKSIWL